MKFYMQVVKGLLVLHTGNTECSMNVLRNLDGYLQFSLEREGLEVGFQLHLVVNRYHVDWEPLERLLLCLLLSHCCCNEITRTTVLIARVAFCAAANQN